MCAEAVLVGDAIDASLRTYLLAAGETAFHIFRRGLHRASAGGHFANVCENVRLRVIPAS
jgi:hypothetical protein